MPQISQHPHTVMLLMMAQNKCPGYLKNPMPSSTPTSNAWQMTQPDIDFIDNMAKNMGFVGRYQINYPKTPTGVWSISQDSMSYDSPNPTADRTVHIDRYSGEVLADIRYHDYSAFGKFMAVGIALHMGTAGIFSILANLLFCLSVIAICISGLCDVVATQTRHQPA